MLTLQIFTASTRRSNLAVTETVILALISLSALVLFQRYEGTRKFAAAAMKRRGATATHKGRPRTAAFVCGVVFSILLALPVATLVLVSFAPAGKWTTQTLPQLHAGNSVILTQERERCLSQ
jgi:ABC-type Fe3+ transport system permease subunit